VHQKEVMQLFGVAMNAKAHSDTKEVKQQKGDDVGDKDRECKEESRAVQVGIESDRHNEEHIQWHRVE